MTDRLLTSEQKVYRIESYSDSITPMTLVKRTASTVTVLEHPWGDTNKKPTERRYRAEGAFYDSWEAANEALITRREREITYLQEKLHRVKSALGSLKARKP